MCVYTFREVSLVLKKKKKESFRLNIINLARKASSLLFSVPFGKDIQIGEEE